MWNVDKTEWADHISMAQFSYNITKHSKILLNTDKEIEEAQSPKASSGLVEARAPEPSEEVEPEPEVPNEVQDSPVPSQGDPAPNSAEGESSQAPSEAPQWQRPKMLMSSCSACCNK